MSENAHLILLIQMMRMGCYSVKRFSLLFLFGLLFLSPVRLCAQEDWEQLYERLLEDAGEDAGAVALEHLYETLHDLYLHPLDLNTATLDELECLPFLSSTQAERIVSYIQAYGPMETMGELTLIEGVDYDTRQLLRHFVRVETSASGQDAAEKWQWKSLWRYGQHEAVAGVEIPFYEKAGYGDFSESTLDRYPNRRYLGGVLRHFLRYNFRSADHLQAGFVLEQDAGEPFFAHGTRTYDYHSVYLQLGNIGCLKSLIVGNYRLRFGQGLVMNTDFSLGKMAALSSLGWGSRGIKKHSSASEHNAFRGAAATFRTGDVEATAFFSFHKQDANLDDNLLITSLKTDGKHRTPLEYSKRGNVDNTLYGGNLTYRKGAFNCGLTTVYNSFNTLLNPASQAYKRYHPRGRHFFTMGADYMYNSYRLNLSGETAFSGNGGWATLNRIQLRAWDDWFFTLVQRYYAKDYWALYANSFSENSDIRNECGIYIGVEGIPQKKWHLSAYMDFIYFPWLKYQVSASSFSGEAMVQAAYSHNTKHKSTLRYRLKMRECDYQSSAGKKYLITHLTHRIRYQQTYSPVSSLQWTAILDYDCSHRLHSFKQGVMLTGRVAWQSSRLPISLYSNVCYFYTDDYDTRISTYERGLLYSYSYQSLYGHGWHGSATVHWDINKLLTALVKISHTCYLNQSAIGTGTELINAPHREELTLQLRWKL